jgi:tetratricopeptide (TPR) repeat protein
VTSQYSAALLYNGLGHYDKALAAAERVCEYDDIGILGWSLTELVEAAVRSGQLARAADALERLSEMTRASGTDWALGAEARSRALLSTGESAEKCYREAIERLGRTRMRPALARAHLLYGEWLRRENRRRDARAARSRRPASSPLRRRPSPGSPSTAVRTWRSGPSYSSAPGPSNGISARCTTSSASAHAESCGGPWPASGPQAERLSGRPRDGAGRGL